MPSENGLLVERAFDEIWSRGRLETVDEIFASDYTSHDPATPDFGKGPETEKRIVTLYRAAFPDLKFTIEHMIEAGNFVTARFTARGTHKGGFWGVAPTNRKIRVEGTVVFRCVRGRIAERWAMWDTLGLMQQLGVVPQLGQPTEQTSQ